MLSKQAAALSWIVDSSRPYPVFGSIEGAPAPGPWIETATITDDRSCLLKVDELDFRIEWAPAEVW